jgi:hypothetical protein
MGRARLGITVAETLRRNRKITITTRATVKSSVNFTSETEARIDCERSNSTSSATEAGICARKLGSRALTRSTTSTVLVPGWRCTASTTARVPLNQLATLSFSTPSTARPTSPRRTGAPLRQARISGP